MGLDFVLKYDGERVFDSGITHNLNRMAMAAGLYHALWRPDELRIRKAKYLIPLLEQGLENLKRDPGYFSKFNPENGWGNYQQLVDFTTKCMVKCMEYPDAKVKAWR